MKEKIICSAIWYEDLKLKKPEILKNFYPININKGIVFSGHRHTNCIYQMVAITGLKTADIGKYIQGFLTNKNRFVNREDAAKIALKSKQITELKYSKKYLYSEDLY